VGSFEETINDAASSEFVHYYLKVHDERLMTVGLLCNKRFHTLLYEYSYSTTA
jgi:hypothetical protein